MTRTLQKIGNSRGLVLSRDMLDHLDVGDAVEVTFEKSKIVLTKPEGRASPGRRRSFEEAKNSTINQYHKTLSDLSGELPTMKPSDIKDHVLNVLDSTPNFLTAYQILEALPERDTLIVERPAVGQHGGEYYGAPSVVAQAAQILQREGLVEIEFIDTRSILFEVNGETVPAGNPAVGIYRRSRE